MLIWGVFSKNDELVLYEKDIWTASSSAFIKSGKPIKIPCDTLDNIIQKLENNQKFVIKIDIEGSEYDALLGSTKTLQNCEKIVIEVHYTDTMTREENLKQVKKILEDSNFSLKIQENGLRVIGIKN